jgi:hypothetical protein
MILTHANLYFCHPDVSLLPFVILKQARSAPLKNLDIRKATAVHRVATVKSWWRSSGVQWRPTSRDSSAARFALTSE